MASYSAVISLLQTLDQQNPELFHGHTAQMLKFLRATTAYFQKSLEEKNRVAASEAKDAGEIQISQIFKRLKLDIWNFTTS
ncbi:hypothetical protein KY284_035944 [Solanum tuberosum]|nr:hypothetical protein KY284_035944 [Solanum tuberosum]